MLFPSIFSYRDYREYLQAYYDAKKSESDSYSYRRFSDLAGIRSPNLLKLVIDRKKNLTTGTLLKFAEALSLSEAETEYFEALVLENQADELVEKKYYASRLRRLRPAVTSRTVHTSKKLRLFEEPRLPALIALIAQRSVDEATGFVVEKLNLSPEEVSRWVEKLTSKQLIRVIDGKYVVDFGHAVFVEHPSDVQLKNYLKYQLRLSNKAFESSFNHGAKFYSHSMGVRPDVLVRVVDEVKGFLAKLNERYHAEPASDLLQINSQVFTLTKRIIS